MPTQKLQKFLDSHDIKYVTVQHSLAFTAIDIAKSAHIPIKVMAKTVIIKIASKPAMVVLPAAFKMDLEILQEALNVEGIKLATEQEFSSLFPDCEVGAMPPFGNLYEMDVFVAESISEQDEIAFNAGSHSEVIRMNYKDYERLVSPSLIVLSL